MFTAFEEARNKLRIDVMRIFVSNDFHGVWPVGTAAVVVAEDFDHAVKLLTEKLAETGLRFDGTLQEVSLKQPIAIVLRDGNY